MGLRLPTLITNTRKKDMKYRSLFLLKGSVMFSLIQKSNNSYVKFMPTM